MSPGDVKRLGVNAYDIDAGHVYVDSWRDVLLAAHLGTKAGLRNTRSSGTTPARRISARAVDILDESVKRADALGGEPFSRSRRSRPT